MDDAPEKPSKRVDVPRYFRIACQFWSDESVLGWTDQMKLIGLYLLSSKHRNLEGFFVLPLEYVAADMKWPLARVRKTLTKLEEAQFARFDPSTNLLLIRNALRYQQPDSLNVQKAVISRVRNLPRSPKLLDEFLGLVRLHCKRREVSPYAQGLPDLLERELKSQPVLITHDRPDAVPMGVEQPFGRSSHRR